MLEEAACSEMEPVGGGSTPEEELELESAQQELAFEVLQVQSSQELVWAGQPY